MNWYKKSAIGGSTSPSPSVPMTSVTTQTPSSEDGVSTPRQIYIKDDVIQERKDLAPSKLRKKVKRDKRRK